VIQAAVGHRDARQRVRAAGARRARRADGQGDADPGKPGNNATMPERTRPVPLLQRGDGALGRAGGDLRDRRPLGDRRLDRNGLRPMRYTVTDRRAADRRLRDRHGEAAEDRSSRRAASAPASASASISRPAASTATRAQGHARRPQALRRVDEAHHAHRRASSRPSGDEPREFDRRGTAPPPARGRLHARGAGAILHPMVEDANEAVGSMGDDTPLAVLSASIAACTTISARILQPGHQPADRQPARDAGDDAATRLGNLGNILDEDPTQCDMLMLDSPVLSNAEFEAMRAYMGDTACEVTAPSRSPRARPGLRRASSASAARPRTACAAAAARVILTDEARGRTARRDPDDPGRRRRAHAPGQARLRTFTSLNVRSPSASTCTTSPC
jgi:glutamate synthase (NADPH) large chain